MDVPKNSTAPCTLERKILDSNIPKNEAEWWARERILDLKQQLDNATKQVVLARDAVAALEKFGTTVAPSSSFWEEIWPEYEKALAATADLAGLVVCDAEPAIWLSIDGQDFSYQQSARFTTPRYEAKEKA